MSKTALQPEEAEGVVPSATVTPIKSDKKPEATKETATPKNTEEPPTLSEGQKPEPNKSKRRPARPSRQDKIKQQANPKSIFSGRQKTFEIAFQYRSDILHEYLLLNQSTMLSAFERLAALLRMVSNDNQCSDHVNEWVNLNMAICQKQTEELQGQREVIADQAGIEGDPGINVIVPEDYATTFEASHPIAHKMLAILRMVDAELNQSETLYLAGILDDVAHTKLRTQATTIVRGVVDRIYKATSPGIRKGGRFAPQQLAQWLREGNRLMFADLPRQYQELVGETANA